MTALKPIASSSLADAAFDQIVTAITSGEFAPGERISEAMLAKQLGISRGPLREALGRLEGKLVLRRPRQGVRVVDFDRHAIEQMFFMREALEGMTARLAAEHISGEELDLLRSLLDSHARHPALASGRAYIQGSTPDDDFHFAILSSSRADRIGRILLDEVYYQLRIHRLRSSTVPGRAKQALEEHHEILAALERRDPDASEKAMRKHIENARVSALSDVSQRS